MNNDLAQFSEERLRVLSEPSGIAWSKTVVSELAALARIALAAKQAKPAGIPREVTAQDMRETLNIPMHQEEAQAAANGFNQCLLECSRIFDDNHRLECVIDEAMREIDSMQENINHKHRCRVIWRDRCLLAEKKLNEIISASDTPPANSPAIPDDWIKCSERMPEKSDEYYLTHSNAGVDVTYFSGRFLDEYATHWMPLPSAPKPESE